MKELVDARKVRIDASAAIEIVAGLERIVSMRGRKIDVLNRKDHPSDEAILALLMGPTGNLRAPTARVGTTLLVGFNAAAYEQELGS